MDVAVVEAGEHPWLGGVKVNGLDPVGPSRQLPLDVESQRLNRTSSHHTADTDVGGFCAFFTPLLCVKIISAHVGKK